MAGTRRLPRAGAGTAGAPELMTMRTLFAGAMLLLASVSPSPAADLVVYGAGSLRESIGEIAKSFGSAHDLTVTTHFGPSGRLREQIEAGDHADLFTSADVGHARKLVTEGRASVMAVFARNTVCLLSPPAFGATTATPLDTLLAQTGRIGISPPKADPLGDYTMALFDAADRLRPGAGANLRGRAEIVDTPPGSPPPKSGDALTDAIQQGRVVAGIVYCSGRERYGKLLPDAALVEFPPNLQVGPEYGLAVMNNAPPEAAMLALTILSPEGQAVLARWGFKPVTLPAP
jgi:molybdate transport system substrate-binding protein